MHNLYEILVIASPDETDEGIDAIIGGLRQQLAASGGEVIDVNRWGRRKLAYPIGKHTEGVYLLIYATGPATLSGEFRAYTKIRESILREMPVRLSDAQETAARQALSERGPVDEELAKAQMEAADQRAAAKRAEAETSVSERDEVVEPEDAVTVADDETATADEAVAGDDDDTATADEPVAIDGADTGSADQTVAIDGDDEAPADQTVAPGGDDAAAVDEAVAVDDNSTADDSDDESAGEAAPADDSSDGVAEGEPRKED